MILRTRALVSAGVSPRCRARAFRFVGTIVNQGCSVAGGTYSARTRSSTFGRRGPSSPRQKRVEHPYEVLRRLDVRGVPGGELDHPRVERRRELPRRLDRHRIVDARHDKATGGFSLGEGPADPLPQVVVAQALPYRLLGPGGDPERGHLAGAARVVEIASHRSRG